LDYIRANGRNDLALPDVRDERWMNDAGDHRSASFRHLPNINIEVERRENGSKGRVTRSWDGKTPSTGATSPIDD
jgi:hypothetical protein